MFKFNYYFLIVNIILVMANLMAGDTRIVPLLFWLLNGWHKSIINQKLLLNTFVDKI